ncbi:MAG: hypothetical protein A2Z20_10070 [Bdellovibrionales bacterium RBG_16_40_8]|nr:MAG: hypothetical protein A2Z20_10070 [Bdellovibrionales bacterium RBG_16_40_8]
MKLHKSFDKLSSFFNEYCSKNSVDTYAGQKLGPIFDELGFKNVRKLNDPFSSKNTRLDYLTRFLKQEAYCYSRMNGRPAGDLETAEILDFIDREVPTSAVDISYGMILWHAEV